MKAEQKSSPPQTPSHPHIKIFSKKKFGHLIPLIVYLRYNIKITAGNRFFRATNHRNLTINGNQ
jgi:hypothetical protein